MPETRFRVVLEYDGTAFAGWQLQPGQRTVQLVVEQALARLVQHPVRISASGRTDAGVHARGQVASFVTTASRTPRAVVDGLGALLPEDVSAVDADVVPLDFDPRRDAIEKWYRYRWVVRRGRSPLRRHRAWHLRGPLDLARMRAAAPALLGRHDFSAFRASGCTAAHPVRAVRELVFTEVDDEVVLDVRGEAFLRHMVRIVAGTLTEVGLGRRAPAWVGEVLASRDRTRAGPTAPPGGLTLMQVSYPG